MAERVIIEHKDGRNYAVLPADFERGIDGDYQGFHVTTYQDGSPYEGPKTAAALRKANETDEPPAKGKKD